MSAPWEVMLSRQGLVLDDFDDWSGAPVTLTPGQSGIQVLSPDPSLPAGDYKIRPFSIAKIASFCQSWDANGNGFMTYHLRNNAQPLWPYGAKTVSLGSPFGDTIFLPKPVDLAQLSLVGVTADLGAGASGSSTISVRVIIYYFKQDSDLQKRRLLNV